MVSYQYRASYLGWAIIFISLWALPARAETASEAKPFETQEQKVEVQGDKEAAESEDLDRRTEKSSVLSEAVDEERWYGAIANVIKSPQPVAEKSQVESTELSAKQEPVGAQEKLNSDATLNDIEGGDRLIPPANISDTVAPSVAAAENHKVNEIEQFSTSAEGLLPRKQPSFTFSEDVQISQSVVQITGVRLNATASGLEVILETPNGQVLQATTRIEGKSAIADIENAQLALPSGAEFRARNPDTGIAEVTVIQLEGSRIRVRVTGEKAAPTAQIVKSDRGLVLGVTPSEQEEIDITVTARQATPYRVPNASTATRTDTPLRDIPQSIQVVPRQVIEDQGITRVSDATRNVSGTTIVSGYGNLFSDVNIRGFYNNPLRDGFTATNTFFINGGNIERVEVLKGPASVLYGALEPGGVVNYVSEQPLRDPYYAAEFTVASYDFYQGEIDLSGPLSDDKRLLYRLNISYESSGSYRDFIDNNIVFIAPVVSYQISDSTDLTLAYEYLNAEQGFDRGLRPASAFFEVDRSLNIGEPDDFQNTENHRLNLTLNHQFNQNLRLRSSFLYLAEEYNSIVTQPGELAADGRTLPDRGYFGGLSRYDNYSLQTDLIAKFNTGAIAHQLLFGVEWRRRYAPDNGIGGTYATTSFDIFDPVYGSERIPDPDTYFEQTTDNTGIYLQDQVTLFSNLKVLVGGRYDFVQYDSKFIADTSIDSQPERTEFYDGAFSPRIGIVYQPIEPISLYASYSRSFVPNNNRTASGEPLEPSRGTQYEVGVKAEFGNLSVTLAAYEITKTNVPTTDPNNLNFSIARGEVTSRGIELDLAGEILPGWNAIASAFLSDAFVSKDNDPAIEGLQLENAPKEGASLWTTYEIQSGDLQGLGFGVGVFFVGDRIANQSEQFNIPSYVRTDAAIYYRRENWRAALNFKNLFNVKYYETNGFLVFPQPPFTIQGTVSVQF